MAGPSQKGKPAENYSAFDSLNGLHPWRKAVPEGCILYPVRQLHYGKVAYFNYPLAKEMGLIPQSHNHRMTKKLERKILDTFNIRIINEYDQQNNIIYNEVNKYDLNFKNMEGVIKQREYRIRTFYYDNVNFKSFRSIAATAYPSGRNRNP